MTKAAQDQMASLHIGFIKFAAKCSGTQSPNDISHGHMTAHTLTHGEKLQYPPDASEQPAYMSDLIQKLKEAKVEKHHLGLLQKFFEHAPMIVAKAFAPHTISESFRGLVPFNLNVLLQKCIVFKNLPGKETKQNSKSQAHGEGLFLNVCLVFFYFSRTNKN